MIEVIRWISIVLLWVVTGLNVVVMIRMKRTSKELGRLVELWKAKIAYYEEITDKEEM